jgi:hypothetical protein
VSNGGRLNVGICVRACIGLPMASPFTTRHSMRSAVAVVAVAQYYPGVSLAGLLGFESLGKNAASAVGGP